MTMNGRWSFNTLAVIFILLSNAGKTRSNNNVTNFHHYPFFHFSNYTALIGVWIYGFFVMVLLALDFLYYSAMNYELCRVYLEKWGLGGRWLKQARSQWHSTAQEGEHNMGSELSHHQHARHSLRGEAQSPTLLTFQTSTAW
uniref:Shisa like 1a n=1 Tax=Cyprinus carpio TaxID=7962 RepID=A0A8C2J3I5_CYPCA